MKIGQIIAVITVLMMVLTLNAEVQIRDSKLKQKGDDPWVNLSQTRKIDPRLRRPVNDLGLTVAISNYLKGSKIVTIGQLVQLTEGELQRRVPQLDKKSLIEIESKLADRDLSLKPPKDSRDFWGGGPWGGGPGSIAPHK